MVRVNSLCPRDRRADIASLCHPVHKPTANTRSTIVAAANRFLLGRHLLHSGTIRKTHVTMASAATATWLTNGSNSRKKCTAITPYSTVLESLRKSDVNRKRIRAGYVAVRAIKTNPNRSQKRLVFPHVLPMKTAVWLGPESNRRHVDFQSTALPTELPSH